MLLTDGEDLEGQGLDEAKRARRRRASRSTPSASGLSPVSSSLRRTRDGADDRRGARRRREPSPVAPRRGRAEGDRRRGPRRVPAARCRTGAGSTVSTTSRSRGSPRSTLRRGRAGCTPSGSRSRLGLALFGIVLDALLGTKVAPVAAAARRARSRLHRRWPLPPRGSSLWLSPRRRMRRCEDASESLRGGALRRRGEAVRGGERAQAEGRAARVQRGRRGVPRRALRRGRRGVQARRGGGRPEAAAAGPLQRGRRPLPARRVDRSPRRARRRSRSGRRRSKPTTAPSRSTRRTPTRASIATS